jgi:porin
VTMRSGGKISAVLGVLLGCAMLSAPARCDDAQATGGREEIGISGNPAATNQTTGTGWLGQQLGIDKYGFRLGGVWIGGVNDLVSGGVDPGVTFNSAFILDLLVNMEQVAGIPGASVGVDFLQFNSQATNTDAGSVLGYIGMLTSEPYNRSELLELWWRQELFDKRLIVRLGKSNPAIDFQDVVRPVANPHQQRTISTVTSLLYGPIFVNPTLYGVLPSFYETAVGATVTWIPSEEIYFAYGVYDGNKARGVSTGVVPPEFNGYYFHIAETGMNWVVGPEDKPGFFSFGGWRQTGRLSTDDGLIEEDGAEGLYFVGSQLLWYRDPEPINDAGISGYVQLGWNNSETLPFNYYVGAGLTARALIPRRPKDSFGVGVAWGWLNPNDYDQATELLVQGYYQAHVRGPIYTESAVSYIPEPAEESGLSPAWALTQQIIVPF